MSLGPDKEYDSLLKTRLRQWQKIMKCILIYINVILIQPMAYAQFDLGGTWECVNKWEFVNKSDTEDGLSRFQDESFPFWIKFNGNQFLISNSNNNMIYAFGHNWTYMKGNWEMRIDTLILHINETRDFSTNTGFYYNPRFELSFLKFIVNQTENHIQLKPLNDFLGYSLDGSHLGFPYTYKLGKGEKLYLNKTESIYYFNDKL